MAIDEIEITLFADFLIEFFWNGLPDKIASTSSLLSSSYSQSFWAIKVVSQDVSYSFFT